jgi:nucleotide-binding universal stress UspA family protein
MKKKILVATDYSKNAWNALSYVIDLYADYSTQFHLVHAYSTTGYAIDSMMVPEPGELAYEQARERAEKGMERIEQHLNFRDSNPNHEFHFHIEFNSLIGAIKHHVEAHDIELVVIGTKGETDATDIIYGSNAVNIMEKVRNCPVLAIPTQVVYQPPKEIVFPTGYKDHFKRRELLHMIEIAEITDASIRVLHIDEEEELSQAQKDNKELLAECLETVDFSFHRMHDVDITTAISCFVQARESDMIAFINRKHNFLDSIFNRPLVKELGYHAQVPVLAMHDLRN